MDFKHFIITRFNVNINRKEYPVRLDASWLAERVEMFNRFCLPSVMGQDCKDFTWLVLFDEKTPGKFRRIFDLYARHENLEAVYCAGFETVMERVRARIGEIRGDASFCLTTRLDNDDALSRKFVGALQESVRAIMARQGGDLGELYINFPNGYQYSDGNVHEFRDPTNAFVSLLERNRPPHTVFWIDHPGIYEKAPVAQIESRPIYLQNVHERNVYNYIRGEQVGGEELLADFFLDL